jgi:hypothetical protein
MEAKNMTVSKGHQRPDEVLLNLFGALIALDPTIVDEMGDEDQQALGAALVSRGNPEPVLFEHDRMVQDLRQFLLRRLDRHTPEGYYFGSKQSDSLHIGFWPKEQNES